MDQDALQRQLDRWVSARLISGDQARAILASESTPTRSDADAVLAADVSTRRALLAEVVGYVGAAFALGAVVLLVGEFWAEFTSWARLTLTSLLALLALASGAGLHGRAGAAVRRLVAVLWTLGIAGTGWTAAILAGDLLDVAERWLPLIVGGSSAVVAAVLLAMGRHVLVQLAAFVACGATAAGTLNAFAVLDPGALAFGTLIVGGGASWGLAGAGGWLGPRRSAEVTGAVAILVGSQVLAGSAWSRPALVVGVLAALALVVLSVPGSRVHLLALGAVGLFVSVPRLIVDLFADTLGAPATLLVTGLLLILVAVGITRLRRAQETDHG